MGLQKLLEDLLGLDSFIQVNKTLIKKFGLHEAILLSELYSERNYWRKQNKLRDEKWFYSTRENLEENTGLTPYYQRDAISNLTYAGILECKLMDTPAKKYYSIVDDKLLKALTACDETLSQLDEKAFNDINNNKKEIITNNNNQKSTVNGALSKNHSQVYKQKMTLTDDLESGKDIDKHEKEKKKSPRDKFKDNCLTMIDDTPYDSETKSLLIEYFSFASDPKQAEDSDARKKIVNNSKLWEQKLNALAQLVKQGNSAKDVVRQSLEKRKYAFWEYREQARTKSYSDHSDGIIAQTLTQEEAREVLKGYAERNGVV